MTEMRPTLINGRWELLLPEHRAVRPQWGEWTDGAGRTRCGWERERLDSMFENIRPGDVVYDIGAEEGDLSALYATWGARLILFEPNPRVWPNIRAIWEANELPAPLNWFVGFAAETGANESWGGRAWPECAYGEVIGDHGFLNLWERDDVMRIAIDTMVELGEVPPDIITIDVEGAELQVLRGAVESLEAHKPLVYCSIHDAFMLEGYGDTASDLFGFMHSLGYYARHLATDHEVHYAFWHPEGRGMQ